MGLSTRSTRSGPLQLFAFGFRGFSGQSVTPFLDQGSSIPGHQAYGPDNLLISPPLSDVMGFGSRAHPI